MKSPHNNKTFFCGLQLAIADAKNKTLVLFIAIISQVEFRAFIKTASARETELFFISLCYR